MPWGDNTNGPWGKSGGNGGGNGGAKKPSKKPDDFEEILKKGKEKFDGIFSGGDGNRPIILAVIFFVILWLASGIYTIESSEQGVVLRFGAFNRIADPGLKYHLPTPIEKVVKVPVTTINRVEVGIRSSAGRNTRTTKILEESLMLTGDENIVDINFEVQWKVRDAKDFLFKVRDPAATVKSVSESAMREVIGRTKIADALTEGRSSVEQESKKIIQEMLDYYHTGVEVVRLQMTEVQPPAEVIEAFRDVQTARADRERLINEAEAYRNDIIPRARGQAEKKLQEAEAYKQQVVAEAQGNASRFVSVYDKYKDAKQVTKERMYLEAMEEILKGMDKILIDKRAGDGAVPYLPLNELRKNREQKGDAQ